METNELLEERQGEVFSCCARSAAVWQTILYRKLWLCNEFCRQRNCGFDT
ncbi:MAG: hypothetical protein IPH74_02825 [Bacteroidetes bacterium]|nr:hypothetical protein [Bacteroidota bacterium]